MSLAHELSLAARAWIDGDPDPETRQELSALLEAGDAAALAERLQPLAFGTAGLRGAVGAGSGRMNLAVVLRTAHGIARYVNAAAPGGRRPASIVIGYDARPTSRGFAEASAGVFLAAGLRVVAFAEPTATPLVAFLGRELGAAITVVVTASHNPRADNGYKVYGDSAVQIIAPVDAAIAAQIESAPPARTVAREAASFASPAASAGLTVVRATEQSAYFAAISAAVPAAAAGRALRIVHSALHGVGTAPMLRTLADAGFTAVSVVPEQAQPDGTFPTTPFPNPEEPGTLDLALAEAEREGADLLLVNDPDADRLAAAARLDPSQTGRGEGESNGWQGASPRAAAPAGSDGAREDPRPPKLTVLDGNQVGALLAVHALSSARGPEKPLVLSSVVSSPLVAAIAGAHGAHHERTHTGFKWLWNAALQLEAEGAGKFCFAYEEALGYSVFPAVRDKDGIAAGRALAELAASLSVRGLTLFDRLFELYAEHGLWMSAARNMALTEPGAAQRTGERLDALVAQSELGLLGERVVRLTDYRQHAAERRPWLGKASLLELELEGGSRLFVRPSGTEPKLKLYAHVRRAVTRRSDFAASLEEARRFATGILQELELALQS
jgi:phosphomannomutase